MAEVVRNRESSMELAAECENRCDWLGAIASYEKALESIRGEGQKDTGDLLERQAFASYKAALQADNGDQFRERIASAIDFYRRAKNAYESSDSPHLGCFTRRCDAMTSFMHYWLAGDVQQKRERVREAWDLTKDALDGIERTDSPLEFLQTFNRLALAAAIAYNYDSEPAAREMRLREALDYVEKANRIGEASGDKLELAKTNVIATAFTVGIEKDFTDPSEKDGVDLSAWRHWLKAVELSKDAALTEVLFMVLTQGWPSACSTDERLGHFKEALVLARKTRDNLSIGCILDGLAQRKLSMVNSIDDELEREAVSQKGLSRAREAKTCLDMIGFTSPNFNQVWVRVPEAGNISALLFKEIDAKKKRELAERAYEPCMLQVKLAKESGYPDIEAAANFMLGIVLKDLGMSEANLEKKGSFLSRSREHLELALRADTRLHPRDNHLHGNDLGTLAEVEFEQANMATDGEVKGRLLRNAIQSMNESLTLCEKDLLSTQDSNPNICGDVATGHYKSGRWATRLHSISQDRADLKIAIEAFERAGTLFAQAGLRSQSAESSWECARIYDDMGEFQRASERFISASKDYASAAEQVPRMREFYEDHAKYMDAWSEIERAKYHHMKQEPELAMWSYEKASAIHLESRRWNYLATNYQAWAQVENAENLSRNERFQESVVAFEEASRLFIGSKQRIHNQIPKIEDPAERQMARKLERWADTRSGYCKARIILEQARNLEKRGDLRAASENYSSACDQFEGIMKQVETEHDRSECRQIILLTKAWKAMASAEAEASPELYAEASRLFEEAKEVSRGEIGKLFALGNSRFCKALEIGTRVSDTGDISLHALVNEHLDSAASYYTKAGLASASEYAMASKLLFEGYVHLKKANMEEDLTKKAKLLMMAEKLLQASISSLEKADQPGKIDQVKSLLNKVSEQKQIAVSLTEVLQAPDILSSTIALSTPTPTYERAIGVERLESANIQATCIVSKNELRVGEELDMDIDFVNMGRSSARLTKVDGIIPEGFELARKPEKCRLDGSSLIIKGGRIAPTSTESLSLVVKAIEKGSFKFKPEITYTDESGDSKTTVAEKVTVTVRELGISGWLKGPQKTKPGR